MFKSIIILLLFATLLPTYAQKKSKKKSKSAKQSSRILDFNQHQNLDSTSLFKNIPFRNVGPTVMSGRVTDIEGNPNNPSEFFVAYASSGLWYSNSNGIDFKPLFQNEAAMTIGDIAVDWNDETSTIWIGTGENNSSRSSYAGAGLFKSNDNGITWSPSGLEKTQHISRIVLHPTHKDTLWVASIGNLYTKDTERGVFKSTDAGKTWKKTLFISDSTGIIDLIIDPKNPKILYASAWERTRKAWDFKGSGAESGIYKSKDGGENWKRITTDKSGFPTSNGVGRIGLTISNSNSSTLYAFLDNQEHRESKEDAKTIRLTKQILLSMPSADFDLLADDDINAFLDKYKFPKQYTAKSIKEDIKNKKYTPKSLVEYLGDAGDNLFNTPVKGAEIYRSDDAGKTWVKTHDKPLDRVVYSFGYYFGNIRIDPTNDNNLYILGVPFLKSEDAGKTWIDKGAENVHVDHHALWINPKNPNHFILGNDGGVNITYDDGQTYFKANSIPVGQFYSVNVDMEKPYNIYGGMQDNGVWVGSSKTEINREWQNSGKTDFQTIMGGDGMQVGIDLRDNKTIYTGYQFGNYYRINRLTGNSKYITPTHNLDEKPLRWNWQSPIHVSIHNSDIIYFGANRFYRSFDKGENFEVLSDDLTYNNKQGNVPFSTLTSISESPLSFGLIYTGSDDGRINRSSDVGEHWEDISRGLPKNLWVSRVIASMHKKERVYVSLNGYRNDDFNHYLYVSDDLGENWSEIGKGLPKEAINVIKEDPKNTDIIYIGTDQGLYISFNKGIDFSILGSLPNVAIHDLVIHPRDNEIIVGTHGRSIYVGQLNEVQKLNNNTLNEELVLFDMDDVMYNEKWGMIEGYFEWGKPYEKSIDIPVFTNNDNNAIIEIMFNDVIVKKISIDLTKGINYVPYNLSVDNSSKLDYGNKIGSDYIFPETDNNISYLIDGEYVVKIAVGSAIKEMKLIINKKEAPKGRVKTKKIP
ncbi:WD40/YVTN/BNR-like repeat-containing protein [Flammeovirga pectinis]|nr:glycosyl hydrolase [Flammeovirga pectinis]